MSINVLVADDSATIQKVVSITLANESVNLISSDSEGDLLAKVKEGNIQAVLLDFGLSQEKSGFDLIQMIQGIDSKIKILAMLPAFEQVDENRLSEAGAFDSIAKPFESSKFIGTFREMISEIDSASDIESSAASEIIKSQSAGSNIGELDVIDSGSEQDDPFNPDQWVSNTSFEDHSQVGGSSSFEEDDEEMSDFSSLDESDDTGEIEMDSEMTDSIQNELSETISDWGIELPSPINNLNASGPAFPPVIGDEPVRIDPELAPLTTNESKEELNIDDDPFVQNEGDSSLFEEDSDSDDEWSMPNQSFEDQSDSSDNLFELEGATKEETPLEPEPIVMEEDFQESLETESFPEESVGLDDLSSDGDDDIISTSPEFEPESEPEDDDFSFEINSNESEGVIEEDEEEEPSSLYPDSDDLEYPDLSVGPSNEDDSIVFEDPASVPAAKRRPQFVDFDDLKLEKDKPKAEGRPRDVEDLEREVESDIDPSNFWDEDVHASSDAVSSSQGAQGSQIPAVDVDKFFNEIKVELLERVDRIVREVCEEKIEKVAWEVIPEIAENLIKKEIKSLTQNEESH